MATDGFGGAGSLESVHFVPNSTLRLEPGERHELQVAVEPAGFFSVEFSLLAIGLDAFDGYLAERAVVTDESGFAINTLAAPSLPATFVVRASAGEEVYADRAVSVSSEGFGTVIVSPKYDGARAVGTWVASGRAGVTCAELTSVFEDGPLRAIGQDDISIEDVPVGPVIAVTVRYGSSVGGCATLDGLASDETRQLEVVAQARPMQLDEGALSLVFELDEATAELEHFFVEAAERGAESFRGGFEDDRELLLADMAAALDADDERQAFEARAASLDFAATLGTVLGASTLTSETDRLLRAAAGRLVTEPFLLGHLELGSSPVFYPDLAGGATATTAGFLGAERWTAAPGAGDVLVLGGPLTFAPTRWLFALAELEDPTPDGGMSVPVLSLVEVADCAALAALLVQEHDELFPGCTESCAESLCGEALALGWSRVHQEGLVVATLSLGASIDTTVNESAEPASGDGSWLGAIDSAAPEGDGAMLGGGVTFELVDAD